MMFRALLASFLGFLLLSATAQAQEYRIRTGDTLAIEVLEDSSLNRATQVLPGGQISFPLIGTINVAGLTVTAAQNTLRQALSDNFATLPNVFVSVTPAPVIPRAPRTPAPPVTISIHFLGEVNTPGTRELEPGTTFLQALANSGGFSTFAATKRVQLRRTDPQNNTQNVTVIDYRSISDGAALIQDFPLQDGDVILVPERRLFE